MPMCEESGEARLTVPAQPAVHGIRIAFLEQSMLRHPMRTAASRDLEDRSATFSNIWVRIVVTMLDQLLLLSRGQSER
jgi:hypothetical protein